MSALLAALLAALPNALIAIGAKFVTESFLQKVLTKVIVSGLRRLSKMSINTVDDELVEDVVKRLDEA